MKENWNEMKRKKKEKERRMRVERTRTTADEMYVSSEGVCCKFQPVAAVAAALVQWSRTDAVDLRPPCGIQSIWTEIGQMKQMKGTDAWDSYLLLLLLLLLCGCWWEKLWFTARCPTNDYLQHSPERDKTKDKRKTINWIMCVSLRALQRLLVVEVVADVVAVAVAVVNAFVCYLIGRWPVTLRLSAGRPSGKRALFVFVDSSRFRFVLASPIWNWMKLDWIGSDGIGSDWKMDELMADWWLPRKSFSLRLALIGWRRPRPGNESSIVSIIICPIDLILMKYQLIKKKKVEEEGSRRISDDARKYR